jgi:hypothetical protein
MKRCPGCNRTYTDSSLNFCLEDGTPLLDDALAPADPNATIRYSAPLDTKPPPTEIYRPQPPLVNQAAPMKQGPPWPGMPTGPQARVRKQSNAVWWILGGVVVIGIIGIGLVIMILALAGLGSNANDNVNSANANSRAVNRNTNVNTNSANVSNVNATSSLSLPALTRDDFSEHKWGTGNFQFGDIWYDNEEYHLRSKEKTFLVMYAPSEDYNTENATVSITARSVDGSAPTSGYGLVVHGEKSKDKQLEDYALLIYTGDEPQYEVVMHKAGKQSTLVPWTRSNFIKSGTNPNQLEARSSGAEISFYINGKYLTRIEDSENFKRGLAGVYTSDTVEVAFDNLEIKR